MKDHNSRITEPEEARVRTVTVSKLKASLSEYLRRVKAGEEVLVIERGRPIAKLTPATGVETLPDYLRALEKQGLVAIAVPAVETNFDLETLRLPGDRRRAFSAIAHERLGLVAYRRRGWID